MSRSPHKLVIKPRAGAEGLVSTGANTVVELDGKRLSGCRSVKFEADARTVTTVTLEIFATVECEVYVDLADPVDTPNGFKMKEGGRLKKCVTRIIRSIGSYAPTGIAEKIRKIMV